MPEIKEFVKKVRENSKKRNFTQSFDLIINLQYIDLEKPEHKIDDFVILPAGRGKQAKIAIFSDIIKEVKDCQIIRSNEIEIIGRNKREVRKLANKTDFFLADPKLMPVVGRHLGQILGPRQKMPKPITGDIEKIINSYKNAVRIIIKKSPSVQTLVGTEDMSDEKIAKNIEAVLNFVRKKLPRGNENIKSVLLKLTMGKPIKMM